MDKLTKNLVNSGLDNFKYTRDFIDTEYDGDEEKFSLLTRKGIYPYDYIDDADKFDEELPPQSEFFNHMTGEELTDDDYELVLQIWEQFDLHSLGDLHDLYVHILYSITYKSYICTISMGKLASKDNMIILFKGTWQRMFCC